MSLNSSQPSNILFPISVKVLGKIIVLTVEQANTDSEITSLSSKSFETNSISRLNVIKLPFNP